MCSWRYSFVLMKVLQYFFDLLGDLEEESFRVKYKGYKSILFYEFDFTQVQIMEEINY